MKRPYLSRRAVLRGSIYGAGLAIGLPPLDAMFDGRGRVVGQAHAADPPMRLMTFFWPNGAYMEELTPKTAGANFELPQTLTPFKDIKSQLMVVTGLHNVGAIKGSGDSHEKGRVCFATGVAPPNGRSAGGPSLEQYAAQKLGMATKIPSLVVAGATAQGGNSQYLSWSAADRPVQPDIMPGAIFAKLFGGGVAGPVDEAALAAVRKKRRSVLDFVKGEVGRLNTKLGASDKLRLNAHLDSVFDIERRIAIEEQQGQGGNTCMMPPKPAADKENPWQWTYDGSPPERMNLLLDLLVGAFRCDVTRFASVNLNVAVAKWISATFPGETRGHHDISHDNLARPIQLAYTRYQVGFIAELMKKLELIPEGAGTLLDSTIIYGSSEISQGNAHNYSNLPVLVGGGRRKLKTGQHVNLLPFLQPGKWDQVKDWVDVSRLFLTLLKATGAPATKWGEATAPLDQLLA